MDSLDSFLQEGSPSVEVTHLLFIGKRVMMLRENTDLQSPKFVCHPISPFDGFFPGTHRITYGRLSTPAVPEQ